MSREIRDDHGRFCKGTPVWNKGKYGYMGANQTSFTKEKVESNCKYSFGQAFMGKDQLVCRCEKLMPVKSKNGKVYMHHKRVSYARWLMEKSLGRELDKNEIIYHKDGDMTNNDLHNLEVITRAELIKRNNKRV